MNVLDIWEHLSSKSIPLKRRGCIFNGLTILVLKYSILKRIFDIKENLTENEKNYGASSIWTIVYCPVFHGHSCCTYNKKVMVQ